MILVSALAMFVAGMGRASAAGVAATVAIGNQLLAIVADAGRMTLWRSDGTVVGTESFAEISGPGVLLTAVRGPDCYLLIPAQLPGGEGVELWKTNLTSAGTVFVASILGTQSLRGTSVRGAMVAAPGFVAFQLATPQSGLELWVSDGTADGTRLVKDINPGRIDSIPGSLTVVGDVVYFAASSPAPDRELWVTDGTEDGTHLFVDANPSGLGLTGGITGDVLLIDGRLWFLVKGGTQQPQLWQVTSAPPGASPLLDLPSFAETFRFHTAHYAFVSVGFMPGLIRTDGTPEGTVMASLPWAAQTVLDGDRIIGLSYQADGLFDLQVGDVFGAGESLAEIRQQQSSAFFPVPSLSPTAGYGVYAVAQYTAFSVWHTDGTPAGTVKLVDLPSRSFVTPVGPLAFITTGEGNSEPLDLWVTDGTAAGTQRLKSLYQPPCLGDCNGDDAVTIDELVLGVAIALEVSPLSRCTPMDRNGDAAVTIDELLAAVERVQDGCPIQQP